MLEKKLVVIFLIVSFLTVLNARTIDFDLKEYRQPEMKRHSLETSFDLGGSHRFSETEREYDDYESSSSGHNLGLTGEGIYSYIHHTDKLQRGISADLYLRKTFNNISNNTTDTSNDRFSFLSNLELSGYNRFYPSNSKFFFETNLNIIPKIYLDKEWREYQSDFSETNIDSTVPSFDYSEHINEYTSITDNDKFSLDLGIEIDPEIIFGFGKIENVSDARLAVYILQDLQDKNCLLKQPSKEEIIKLAELISTIKNERFFDNRDKRIEDITKIDKFLSENGFTTDKNAAYFTSIYDNWDYANQPRYNGFRFSVGFKPEFQFANNSEDIEYIDDRDGENEYDFYISDAIDSTFLHSYSHKYTYNTDETKTSSRVDLFGMIKYEHRNPINLYLQGDFESTLEYGRVTIDQETKTDTDSHSTYYDTYSDGTTLDTESTSASSSTSDSHEEYDYLRLDLRYSLRYYMNTRTDFGMAFLGRYTLWDNTVTIDDGVESEFSNELLNLSLIFNANYYLSPQLRLRGNIGSHFYATSYDNDGADYYDDQFYFNYRLSMDYYMF